MSVDIGKEDDQICASLKIIYQYHAEQGRPHCTVYIDLYLLLILHNMPTKALDRVLAATAMRVQRSGEANKRTLFPRVVDRDSADILYPSYMPEFGTFVLILLLLSLRYHGIRYTSRLCHFPCLKFRTLILAETLLCFIER